MARRIRAQVRCAPVVELVGTPCGAGNPIAAAVAAVATRIESGAIIEARVVDVADGTFDGLRARLSRRQCARGGCEHIMHACVCRCLYGLAGVSSQVDGRVRSAPA